MKLLIRLFGKSCLMVLLCTTFACDDFTDSHTRKGSWVQPHITRNGRIIKGHYRNAVNYSPDAAKNRIRSRSYYQRNKYRYRKSR